MKIYAYFLPQFYPTPENDEHWGKDFTEWVNVKSGEPLYKGHKQPYIPSKFGYYDLSKEQTLKGLCSYSQEVGIDGFCYWHYWFGNGFKTLEKVPEMHLANKDIKQKFFLSWANHDWTKSWVGDEKIIIFKQTYSKKSAIEHFEYLQQFIEDERYIRIKGKPVLQVFEPETKECHEYIQVLEDLALKTYGNGFYWLFPERQDVTSISHLTYSKVGFSPANTKVWSYMILRTLQQKGYIKKALRFSGKVFLKALRKNIRKHNTPENNYLPCILSGWDNTPRYKNKGFVIEEDIPEFMEKQFEVIREEMGDDKLDILFIKAWNEWAEGNILEPYSLDNKTFEPGLVVKKLKEIAKTN